VRAPEPKRGMFRHGGKRTERTNRMRRMESPPSLSLLWHAPFVPVGMEPSAIDEPVSVWLMTARNGYTLTDLRRVLGERMGDALLRSAQEPEELTSAHLNNPPPTWLQTLFTVFLSPDGVRYYGRAPCPSTPNLRQQLQLSQQIHCRGLAPQLFSHPDSP
jgi:hypothetical protein